jgi:hypothetical protein
MSRDIKKDVNFILDESLQAINTLDELALLRASLRAYVEGMTAEDAVAWAAGEISNSISK